MSTTIVSYNGILLHGVFTREYDAEAVYDASGTDVIGTKIKFTFQGMLHDQGQGTAPTRVEFGNGVAVPNWVPEKAVALYQRLMQARCELIVYKTVNNNPQRSFVCKPATLATINQLGTDVNNGPRPLAVHFSRIVGDRSFQVTFTIECMTGQCADAYTTPKAANPVISNRWSVSEAMDEHYMITRTIRGRIRLSHALASAHAYRQMIVPALENGFHRVSLDYEALETGLEAVYSVVDRQVVDAAPYPLVSFTARHEERSDDCLSFTSSMTINAAGSIDADKPAMFMRAFQIADSRLNFINAQAGAQFKFFIQQAAMVDVISTEGPPQIELSLVLRRYDENISGFLANLMTKGMGQPLKLPNAPNGDAYDRTKTKIPATYGYNHKGKRNPLEVAKFFQYCYLQDPCQELKSVYGGEEEAKPAAKNDYVPEETKTTAKVVKDLPPSSGDYFDQQHKKAIYISAAATSRYVQKSYRVQLPLAWRSSANSDTSAAVKVSDGVWQRIIKVDTERLGDWPQIPRASATYLDGDIRGRLLRHWVEALPPTLTPDAKTRIYRLRAYYVYAINRPPRANERLRVGKLPFSGFTQAENALPPAVQNTELGP